jgi:hypothetical protein
MARPDQPGHFHLNSESRMLVSEWVMARMARISVNT